MNTENSLPKVDNASKQPIYDYTRDYGFDFDEVEIERELLAQAPVNFANQPIHDVDADEFEACYLWFIS